MGSKILPTPLNSCKGVPMYSHIKVPFGIKSVVNDWGLVFLLAEAQDTEWITLPVGVAGFKILGLYYGHFENSYCVLHGLSPCN